MDQLIADPRLEGVEPLRGDDVAECVGAKGAERYRQPGEDRSDEGKWFDQLPPSRSSGT